MGVVHFVGLTKDRCRRFRHRSTPRTHFVLSISATFRHLRGIRAARHPTFELRDGSFPENLYRVNFNERSRDSWIDSGEFFFQLTLVFYCSNIYCKSLRCPVFGPGDFETTADSLAILWFKHEQIFCLVQNAYAERVSAPRNMESVGMLEKPKT